MTHEEIDELQAGREMDALVAKQIFQQELHDYCGRFRQSHCDGNKVLRCGACGRWGHGNCYGNGAGAIETLCEDSCHSPSFSSDIAAACDVIEGMEALGYWCQMRTPFGPIGSKSRDGYWAGFTPHLTTGWNGTPDHNTRDETLPLAICRAALKALAPPLEQRIDAAIERLGDEEKLEEINGTV